MKKTIILLFIMFSFAPTFQSCVLFRPVQIVSPYNAALVTDLTSLGMEGDMLYATMEFQDDKTFETHSPTYARMLALANSIKTRIEAMPKNDLMINQAKNIQAALVEYIAVHQRKGVLNNSEIKGNAIYFKHLVDPLLISATTLK